MEWPVACKKACLAGLQNPGCSGGVIAGGASLADRGRGLPMMRVPPPLIWETSTCPMGDLDVSDATPEGGFGRPDLTAVCRLDELGLEVTGQRLEPDRAVLACRVTDPDEWCRRCGCQGVPRDTVLRRLAHEPFGWRPTTLLVTVRRYRCPSCARVWRQDTRRAAEPRAKLSRRALRWALEGLVVAHLTVARVAEGLGVSWNTANAAVLAEGRRVLIDDPDRLYGVTVIGGDEHVWRHTRRGEKYVTVIIDLTGVRDGTRAAAGHGPRPLHPDLPAVAG